MDPAQRPPFYIPVNPLEAEPDINDKRALRPNDPRFETQKYRKLLPLSGLLWETIRGAKINCAEVIDEQLQSTEQFLLERNRADWEKNHIYAGLGQRISQAISVVYDKTNNLVASFFALNLQEEQYAEYRGLTWVPLSISERDVVYYKEGFLENLDENPVARLNQIRDMCQQMNKRFSDQLNSLVLVSLFPEWKRADQIVASDSESDYSDDDDIAPMQDDIAPMQDDIVPMEMQ